MDRPDAAMGRYEAAIKYAQERSASSQSDRASSSWCRLLAKMISEHNGSTMLIGVKHSLHARMQADGAQRARQGIRHV